MTIYTHRNHRVHVIEGDAAGIVVRGHEIENLGEQMIGAAGVLGAISGGATEEKGRSIERIRDEVGEVHAELRLAGDRYKPTGTAMAAYGTSLDQVQNAMRSLVQEIETAKAQADSKRAAAEEAAAAAEASADYAADDDAAQTQHRSDSADACDAQSAAGGAEAHLDELLESFDAQWDTWDEAYEIALGKINGATQGNVTDDWTDNLAGVAEVVVNVLSVVGFVVAIAAIVIGGPILLIAGAIIGAIALIATAFLYFKGRAGLDQLLWSVVGVLPFGKLGSLFKAGQRMQALKIFAGPVADIAEGIGTIRSVRGVVSGVATQTGNGLGAAARTGLASRVADTFAGIRWGDVSNPIGNAWRNLTRGGLGSWGDNALRGLDAFTGHHQNVVRSVSGSGGLIDELGALRNLNLGEQLFNAGDLGVKTFNSANDAWGVASGLFATDPADSWRQQLAR